MLANHDKWLSTRVRTSFTKTGLRKFSNQRGKPTLSHLKPHRFSGSGSSSLQKSHSWEPKGPQLRRNCGPFARSFGLFQACFQTQKYVDKIQLADYQQARSVSKIRIFSSSRSLGENIAHTEAEKLQIVLQKLSAATSQAPRDICLLTRISGDW